MRKERPDPVGSFDQNGSVIGYKAACILGGKFGSMERGQPLFHYVKHRVQFIATQTSAARSPSDWVNPLAGKQRRHGKAGIMENEDAWHQTDRLHAATGKGDPFAAAMRATRMPMIVTDPRLADNPIVFANDAFLKLTGYSRDEVLWVNCRMLQGPLSDMAAVDEIRSAVHERRDVAVDLLNYRKDGSTFWNALYVSPVFNEGGELQYFFASQLDVTDRKEAELKVQAAKDHFETEFLSRTEQLRKTLDDLERSNAALTEALSTKTALVHEVDHRVKNNLQMITALIMMQSRAVSEPARVALLETLNRVEALGTVHRRLYQSSDVTQFDVGEFLKDLIGDLSGLAARGRVKTIYDIETIVVPAEEASTIALIVNEVTTNAFKHAFPEGRTGTLNAIVKRVDQMILIGIGDDGVGMVVDADKTTFGTSLVKTLAKQLKAKISWSSGDTGTIFNMLIPGKLSPTVGK